MQPTTYMAELLGMGMPELLIILAIVFLLFGAKKLPELSKAAGESVRELRNAASETSAARNELKAAALPGRQPVQKETRL
jgi:TatA/E family protein of Tat protein translocase